MKDVMIDLETFGGSPDACIVQIGAVWFDRLTGELGKKFKKNIDANKNGRIEASTVYWWLTQSENARQSVCSEPRDLKSIALYDLNQFLEGCENIWSHATFDFVILMQSFKEVNIKPNFSFRQARDIRTLLDLSRVNWDEVDKLFPRKGTHHDALDDAIFQAAYCSYALQHINSWFTDY